MKPRAQITLVDELKRIFPKFTYKWINKELIEVSNNKKVVCDIKVKREITKVIKKNKKK